MNISEKIKVKRTNCYAPSDSGVMFLLALLLPQVLGIVLLAILKQNALNSLLFNALVPQCAMVIGFLIVSERRKVNYKTANQINFKLNIFIVLIVILIGIVALYGFSPYIDWFDSITTSLGYKSSLSNVELTTFSQFMETVLLLAIIPAIVEEFIFRGVITNGLKVYGKKTAIILSAVFFALIHQNLQQLIYQLFLGLVMAYIVIKTGSIIYTIILHFFNNFVVLLSTYLSSGVENNIDYSKLWNNIYPTLLMILAVVAVIGLLFLLDYVQKRQTKKVAEKTAVKNEIATENLQVVEPKIEKQKIETQNNEAIKIKGDNNSDMQTEMDKFYKNPVIITAFVTGILFWIFAIYSSFGV